MKTEKVEPQDYSFESFVDSWGLSDNVTYSLAEMRLAFSIGIKMYVDNKSKGVEAEIWSHVYKRNAVIAKLRRELEALANLLPSPNVKREIYQLLQDTQEELKETNP